MTQEQLATLETEIQAALNLTASTAGVLDPQILPFIILGKAVAAAAPGLITSVQNLASGTAPTPASVSALAVDIAALASPETA